MNKSLLVVFITLMLAGGALSQMKEITGFKVPDYDENNNLTSQISGDKALFQENNKIKFTNLKIEAFKNGEVETTITSPECVFDQNNRTGQSKSRIRIERDNMVITGEDYRYDSKRKNFTIKKDVKVVLINKSGGNPFAKEQKDD